MKSRILKTSLMVLMGILFLLITGRVLDAQYKDSLEAIFMAYHFPAYPKLTHLCQQRVYIAGQGAKHITWDAFASEDTSSVLVDFYRKHLGAKAFSPEEKGGGTWRFPQDKPERVLSIMSVDAEGPHQSCDRKPPAKARSIIIVSRYH